MSFGIFESATADDLQNEQRKKLAGTRLAQAAADVDSKLGPMLSKSTSVRDYHDRVRLAEKDFRSIVGKYLEGEAGFIAVAKKLEPYYTQRRSRTSSRRVVAADWTSKFTDDWSLDGSETEYFVTDLAPNVHLRAFPEGGTWYWQVWNTDERGVRVHVGRGPARNAEDAMKIAEEKGVDFMMEGRIASRRVANNDLEDLKEFVHSLGAKTRKRRGRDGFMFPAATGANGAISIRPNGEIVVETVFGGGAGGMQSVYSPNEIDLVKDWIEKTVGGSYRMSNQRRRRLASRRIANSWDWGDKDFHGHPWPDDFDEEDKEEDWLDFAKEHPANLYDIGDMLEDRDFLKAPIGTSVTVPTDDFDGDGNPGEFDLVKGPGGGWHNQDFKADLHWSEIGQAPASNIPDNRRRR